MVLLRIQRLCVALPRRIEPAKFTRFIQLIDYAEVISMAWLLLLLCCGMPRPALDCASIRAFQACHYSPIVRDFNAKTCSSSMKSEMWDMQSEQD